MTCFFLLLGLMSGAGGPWTLAYVMKRIPKGWIFRQYPGPYEAIIEGPNYEVRDMQSRGIDCDAPSLGFMSS